MKNAGYLVIAVVVIAAIAVAAFLFMNGSRPSGAPYSSSAPATLNPNSSLTQFNGSKYASYAYMLYPNRSDSAGAQVAMSDFNESIQTLQNGSASVTMNFTDTHAVYTVTVKQGFRLYFLDRNLGDDSASRDATGGDDGYLLVDPSGYITNVTYPLMNA